MRRVKRIAIKSVSPLALTVGILSAILLPYSFLAQTHVSGEVEGNWWVGSSPYIVDNTIWVAAGSALYIQDNVDVLFTDEDSLIVFGTMQTVTPLVDTERVVFAQMEGSLKKWQGIYFIGPDASGSVLTNAVIKDATLGVKCINCGPVIINNYISVQSCGFYSYLSNPIFEMDTVVIDYDSIWPIVVVGVRLDQSLLNVDRCLIDVRSANLMNEVSVYGIHSVGTSLKIRDNKIYVWTNGKPVGIFISGTDKDSVTYNEIVVNSETAFVKAAILQSDCANGVILNNTIDIEGPGKDTGLLFQNSSYGSDIRNNIIRGDNYCIGLVFNLSSPAQIQYNDVYRFSTLILGYPGLDSTNIYADPLFLGVVPDSIYYLTSHSPCIDTGDPEMLDPDGTRSDMGAYCYLHSSTGIDNEILPLQGYQLLSCYPNPTNNSTIISFVLNCSGTVEISVFDVNGRLVVEFLPGNLEMGQYKINWDLRDLASGIYFVNLVSLQGNEIQKLVVIK